jgi:hypothetical protein
MRFLTARDNSQSSPGVPHARCLPFVRYLHRFNLCFAHSRHAGGIKEQGGMAQDIVLRVAVLFLSTLTFAQTAPESLTNRAQLIAPVSGWVYVAGPARIDHRSPPDKTADLVSSKFAHCHFPPFANHTDDRGSRQWQAEWAAGNQLAAEVEREETLMVDPVVSEYLNRLEQSIVRNSDLNGCFLVKLLNDAEVNAYALPGGFLYMTSGLILLADSEDQLTAALAHETGHVTARHFAKIQREQRIWDRLALAGGPP